MKNIDEMVILGHSLEDVNISCFEKIFKNIDNSKTERTV